jgi:ADP-heptose:LPS heptosyltransferase
MSARALLICAGGGIGDSLLASVCGRALRQKFAAVDALTLPGHRDTLARVPDLDDVLVDDGEVPAAIGERLRPCGYAAAIVTWATRRTAEIPVRAAIPVRVGQARRLYSRMFTHRVVVRSERGDVTSHWSQILLDYPRAIGCDAADFRPVFVTTPQDGREAAQLLEHVRVARPFGIVHPTCAATARRGHWPLEGWSALIEALQARFALPLLLSGAQDDEPILQSLAQRSGAVSIAGATSIGGFAALAQQAAFLVVMHSGPMHVAAAVGTPTVGIFPLQADFPDRWAPLGPHVSIVRASFRCRPGERMENCPDYACVAHLDVPRVLAALDGLLAARTEAEVT